MRVTESDVSMLTAHVKDAQSFEKRRYGVQGGSVVASGGAVAPPSGLLDQAEISDMGKLLAGAAGRPEARGPGVDEMARRPPRLEVMRLVLEKVMGVKVMLPQARSVGAGAAFETDSLTLGTETSGFQATGTVRTEDGREIAFDLTVERHGEHTDLNGSTRPPDGTRPTLGPLVLNATDQAADLSDETMRFDLDADGDAENVSLLRSGSAFLALDRNADGRVNDGSELFGPSSGYAFDELRAFDVDLNGWIDEGDPVFAHLKLWTPDRSGRGSLTGIAESGVGAIGLESRETPFELHDEQDVHRGAVHATGVYLAEDGTPGIAEQLDLMA